MESPSNGAEPEQETPTITVTFTPEGQMQLTTRGVGPPQMWAAARLIELWGDSEFTVAQMAAAEQAGKSGGRIVVPGAGKPALRRVD